MAFTEALCPTINKSLEESFPSGILQHEVAGLVDAITSATNTDGFDAVPVDNGNGTRRTVNLTYQKSLGTTDFQTSKPNLCLGGIEKPPSQYPVTVTKVLSTVAIEMSLSELQKLCEPGPTEYKAKLMMRMLNRFWVELDKLLWADVLAGFGNFFNTGLNAAIPVPILKADGSVNFPGMADALEAYEDIGGTNKPIIVGGGNVSKFHREAKLGCCNSEQGINLALANGEYYFFRDKYTNAALGTNHFAMWLPGTFQLVTFNEYRGVGAVNSELLQQGTITDPFNGVTVDFKIKYDDCNEKWVMAMDLRYQLVFTPLTLFPAGDMSGVNGSLHFIGTQLP